MRVLQRLFCIAQLAAIVVASINVDLVTDYEELEAFNEVRRELSMSFPTASPTKKPTKKPDVCGISCNADKECVFPCSTCVNRKCIKPPASSPVVAPVIAPAPVINT
mmetsp:Transcript_2407/g.3656  ORF Transcript_2407/g.3656 Transcript_2407/m.3656 type:complete len:107 (-) Transcript_2407:4672-4992(-)